MNRASAWTGAALLSAGLLVFGWKALWLQLPITPSLERGSWTVELEIDARGSGGRGSVRVALPPHTPGQLVFDERVVSDQLTFDQRERDDRRTGVWSGRFSGVHQLSYAFRVQLLPAAEPAVEADREPPPAIEDAYLFSSIEYPIYADIVSETLASLGADRRVDLSGRLRTLWNYVANEIAVAPQGSDDALIALSRREASELGQARVLVTLLRASRIPARLAQGLRLRAGVSPLQTVWVEAWAGGWLSLSPSGRFFGRRPADLVLIGTGEAPLVATTALDGLGYRFRSIRERLQPAELSALMVPPNPVLEAISLYRLPVATQEALRLLLIVPIGTLFIAVFRNVIGVPTFGTFMPVLIALALRTTGLGYGLAMVAGVIAIGLAGRLLLDRLQLLLVPRLCVLLCLVILAVTAFALLGRGVQERDLFAGILFPIVILAMLIERFSVTAVEEGFGEALTRLGYSVLVAAVTYPIFRVAWIEHLMFGFPELVLSVMGVLVWLGSYTGYRVSELLRFRALARAEGAHP